jgi:hypothetical protein
MCGACGLLANGSDWLDRADDVQPGRSRLTALAERQRRIALVNRLLEITGVRIREQGRQLVVRGPTGRTMIVTDLAHVWAAVDVLGGPLLDPLDETFLRRVSAE